MRFPSLLLTLALGVPAMAADKSPVAEGAKPELVSDAFKFTEGPAVDASGNVYFTDQPNDRIHVWNAADNQISTFLEPCGRSNGLCFDKDGFLWACADGKNELWKIDVKTKKHTVVVKDFGGKLLNGPNDVWVRPDGGLYFTDPFYKRDYWAKDRKEEQDKKALYFVGKDGKPVRVDDDFGAPNGLVGTPDGKTLYVADINKRKTYQYDIQDDGTLKNRKEFCKLGSDGMTLDDAGNVYLTGGGVTIFDKTGQRLTNIAIPGWTANVCFGGKDMSTLFITAGKSVYTLKMTTKGAARQ